MKKLILVAALSMVATGCAQQTFVMSSEVSATTNDALPTKEQSQHFFIDGIAQDKEIDAAAVCGGADKVVKVEVQQTFTNVVLDVVTFGIYTPREARVYCKS
ncbi:Bor family protein [Vibrio atypicus]|uniref:Bor family protein n=1 Tax=Vibrio atypicus TaxID=558271 RepID=UPI001356DD59|nr:Bor family protein [Vibrio atypicus]